MRKPFPKKKMPPADMGENPIGKRLSSPLAARTNNPLHDA
jgi:hypothetical protein